MTLTQTIVAPWGIWQCADYRLTDPQTGEIVENWSQKSINVLCNDGQALITYTGVGRLKPDDPDISDWLANQLHGFAITIPETIKRIEKVASRHLTKYSTPHIFTVGTIIQGQTWAFEVANVELDVDWFSSSPLKSFRVYGEKVTNKPLVLVRGVRGAVSQADWKLLRNETKVRPRRSKKFLKLLAGVNKRASAHERLGKHMSPECCVAYMGPGVQGVRAKSFEWGNKGMPWRMAAPATLAFGVNSTEQGRSVIASLQEEVLKNKALTTTTRDKS